MAGGTSRLLFNLTFPSLVVVTVLWILHRRRNSSNASIQRSHSYPIVYSMSLENLETPLIIEKSVSCFEEQVLSDMQLKGDPTQQQTGVNEKQNGTVVKSKAYVNGSTCAAAKTDNQTNDAPSNNDKEDNHACSSKSSTPEPCKEKNMNGVSSRRDGDITQLALKTKNLSISVEANGHSNCNKDISENAEAHKDVILNGCNGVSNWDTLANGKIVCANSITDELTCDTSYGAQLLAPDVILAPSPESDGATSSISEPSVDGCTGDVLKSPAVSLDSNDCVNRRHENQNIFDDSLEDDDEFDDANARTVHEFEIPQSLCGLLIGRNGRYVKFIKEKSNADIKIQSHPYVPYMKACLVMGTSSEISKALSCIRERFPTQKYPELTLSPLLEAQPECPLPVTVKLSLPEGVTFDVILSSVVDPGHFFVHQPTHPTYHTLSYLSNCMSSLYTTDDAPKLCRYSVGFIVAAPIGGGWYRTEIMHINEECGTCLLKILDFGGFATLPLDSLRQLRYDFSVFPFQATECFLGNVTYLEGEDYWSEEAKTAFIELAQGILQGVIVGFDPHSIPYVHLFRVQGASSLFINQELVNRGLARWVDGQPSSH